MVTVQFPGSPASVTPSIESGSVPPFKVLSSTIAPLASATIIWNLSFSFIIIFVIHSYLKQLSL
jgi:choline-glycine betaine transporter